MPFKKCPICGKGFQYESVTAAPDFPFCSERCKLVDLGHWLQGRYAIPGSQEEDASDSDKKDEDEQP